MAFVLPDLVIESILRDGFKNIRNDESIVDDVFANLTRAFANKKYGQEEIEKIKKIVREKEISIVHSFGLVTSKIPCISIQLADDREDIEHAHIGDWEDTLITPFTDPDKIANTVIVESFDPTTYDSKTGILTVPDSVNLASVHTNHLFVDASGVEHLIIGGIVNDDGAKQIIIELNSDVDLGSGAEIKSQINYDLYEKRGNLEQVQLILGIHTQDPLLTKYVYILVKYFLLSRKKDIHSRDLELSTYSGSDFHRNMDYGADTVYTRFLNVNAKLQNSWRSDKVQLVDNVNVKVLVPKDELGNEALNLENKTIQVKE